MRRSELALCALVALSGCRQVLGLDDLECRSVFATATDYDTATAPQALTVADINVDGVADVITANFMSGNVSRFLSNGDGTVAAKSDHGSVGSPIDLAPGDVTGDGVTDLVVLSNGNNGFMVMRGDGNEVGGLTPEPGIMVASPRDIEIADFNRDGTADIVIASDANAAGHSFVYLGQGDGTLGTAVDYGGPVGTTFVRIGDYNGDRVLDLLVAERTGDRPLVVLPGKGDGTFGERIDSENPVAVLTLVVGDVNNDGVTDAILGTSDPTTAQITVMLGAGDGTFTTGTPMAQPVTFFPHGLVDIDGDAMLDLVGEVNGMGAAVMVNTGGGMFSEATVYPTSADPNFVTAANIDSDEVPELIALLNGANKIAILDGSCSYAPE